MSEPKIAGTRSIKLELPPGTYSWCRCGTSANQPWCDGSHRETEFKPLVFKLDEPGKCSLCACKHTATPPFCDHTHRALPGYEPKPDKC